MTHICVIFFLQIKQFFFITSRATYDYVLELQILSEVNADDDLWNVSLKVYYQRKHHNYRVMILTIQSGNDRKQFALTNTMKKLKENAIMCAAFAVIKPNSVINTSGFLQHYAKITFKLKLLNVIKWFIIFHYFLSKYRVYTLSGYILLSLRNSNSMRYLWQTDSPHLREP